MRYTITAKDSLNPARSHTGEFESEISAKKSALGFAATLLDKGNGDVRRVQLEIAKDDGRAVCVIDIAFANVGDDSHLHDAEIEAHPS